MDEVHDGAAGDGDVSPGACLAGRWRVAGAVGTLPGGVVVTAVDERLRKRVRLVVTDGPLAAPPPHPRLPIPLATASLGSRAIVAFPFWDGALLTLPNRPIATEREVKALVARALEVLEVLDHLHRSTGRAHGHLSLSSFWRGADGGWTLLDAGTTADPDVRFSSPDDSGTDPRADLYALAAIVLAAATGGLPFGSGEGAAVAHRLLLPPETDALPTPILEVLRTALQKAPHHRFSSARRMSAALHQALDRVDGLANDPLDAPERVPVGWSDGTLEPPPLRRHRARPSQARTVLFWSGLAFVSFSAWVVIALVGLLVGRAL